MRATEHVFERVLWNSRLLALVAVVASLILAIALFYVTTVNGFYLLGEVAHYANLDQIARDREHAAIVVHVANIVDGYLFAAIMIIFSFGLYELFIGRIEAAERSEVAPRLLLIRNLDDLKGRLAKVVFLILVVRYFEYALQSEVSSPLDLLYLAVGIALIALSLYLTNRSDHGVPAGD
ncbi:MAG: YqhA family protein [Candidatus Eremiobacteraeota bacterium]|nr:YqhA family protein [Candidatus Eremiobacteraeota bacterium]